MSSYEDDFGLKFLDVESVLVACEVEALLAVVATPGESCT